MALNLSIEPAQVADIEILTEIAHAAKRYWSYPEALIQLWKEDLTITAAHLEHYRLFCGWEVARIVGFYALELRLEAAELEALWVWPADIGRGIGTRLFQHATEVARAHSCKSLTVVADPHALGFYQKMGAQKIDEVPGRPPGRRLPRLRLALL
jgi:GNAT superfamily N-acetyltransferase